MSCARGSAQLVDSALTMPGLFSDHMVLEQKCRAAIWGSSMPGQQIRVFGEWGSSANCIADAQGHWKTRLVTPAAGGPYTITVRDASRSIVLRDVLIGEVWLAAGQSNMDIPLKGWPPGDTILHSAQEIADASFRGIRFMKVPFATAAQPLDKVDARWNAVSPEVAGGVSATAYFYARELYRRLHLPIGIIISSIGGTPAEAWTSKAGLAGFPEFDKIPDGSVTINSNTPTVLFNAMIHPLIPYSIKGIVWYQGESNVGRAAQYRKLFPAMIGDWRNQWGSVLPFYYVQLAPYLYTASDQKNQSQYLRDAQRYALALDKTGMVSTLDIGYLKTGHPPNKQEVGRRLALLALAGVYDRKGVASGPLFAAARSSGRRMVVRFRFGDGLVAGREGLYNFEVAGADKRYFKADATIRNNRLLVESRFVDNPLFVRYAWSDSSRATLFNKEGLPAATFSSETP